MKLRIIFLSLCATVSASGVAQKNQAGLSRLDWLIEEARYAVALTCVDSLEKTNAFPVALLQNKRAQILTAQGNLQSAMQLLERIDTRALDLFTQAITLTNKGVVNLNQGRYDLAISHLTEGWETFQRSERAVSREAIQCLTNLSSVYASTGRYKQAEEHELLALQYRQTLSGTRSEEVAAAYNNLGLIYMASDLNQSLAYYEKSLALYTNLYPASHPKIAISNTNLGVAYVQLGRFKDATTCFDTARKIWEAIYPQGHPNTALVLRNLGRAYSKLKDQDSATEFYRKAISMYQKSYGQRHPDLASTLNELGLMQLNASDYPTALYYAQQSLIANAQNFASGNIQDNPLATDYYNPTVLVYSLHLKAKILEAQYEAKTLRLDDLKLALRCLYTCDSLIDNIRNRQAEESDKLALGTLANEVYEDGVRIALRLSENVLTPTRYAEEAFYFAEKSKASVLLAAIAEARAKSFAGIPAALLEQERSIKSAIMLLNQQLAQKPEAEKEKQLRKQLFDTNTAYYQFIHKLEQEYPDYYNLKYGQQATRVSDLQQTLDAETAILSYFLADTSKTLYIFTITHKRLSVFTRSIPDDFYRYLNGLKNSIVFSEPVTFTKASEWLSELLIPRLPSTIHKLIVIPSGKLSTLPFEVLVSKRNKRYDFSNAAYLLDRFSISYEFAASLMLQKKDRQVTDSPSILLCAPVTFPQGLSDLPATEQEVTRIATLFPARARVALHEVANEATIKSQNLSAFDYLHFATHGVADEVSPGQSRLSLTAAPPEDGDLYTGEIYTLNLHAKLAVLSACETGLGKLSKGEGVIGLSRALIYAGAENLVVSFWNVSDESTAVLMENFYTNLLNNKQHSFGDALRSSKLQLIKQGRYTAPYYWAPFILVGR